RSATHYWLAGPARIARCCARSPPSARRCCADRRDRCGGDGSPPPDNRGRDYAASARRWQTSRSPSAPPAAALPHDPATPPGVSALVAYQSCPCFLQRRTAGSTAVIGIDLDVIVGK